VQWIGQVGGKSRFAIQSKLGLDSGSSRGSSAAWRDAFPVPERKERHQPADTRVWFDGQRKETHSRKMGKRDSMRKGRYQSSDHVWGLPKYRPKCGGKGDGGELWFNPCTFAARSDHTIGWSGLLTADCGCGWAGCQRGREWTAFSTRLDLWWNQSHPVERTAQTKDERREKWGECASCLPMAWLQFLVARAPAWFRVPQNTLILR